MGFPSFSNNSASRRSMSHPAGAAVLPSSSTWGKPGLLLVVCANFYCQKENFVCEFTVREIVANWFEVILESAVLPLVRRVTAALSLSPLLCDCESNLYPYYCFGSADSPVLKRKWRCAALSCRAWMQVVLGKVCGDMELQR